MAERIFKSAGVVAREIDLSAPSQNTPTGIPAGVIGTADEGPAFVPVTVSNFTSFQTTFGAMDGSKFGPIAVNEWLRNAQSATYVRVLGIGDGKRKNTTSGKVTNAGFVVGSQQVQSNGNLGNNSYANSGNGAIEGRTYFLGCFMSESAGSTVFSSAGIQTNVTSSAIIRGVLLAPSGVILHLSGNSNSNNTPVKTQTARSSNDAGMGRHGAITGSVNLSTEVFSLLLNGHKSTTTYPNVITASFDLLNEQQYFRNVFNTDPTKIEQAGHLLYSSYDVHPNLANVTGSGVLGAGNYSVGTASGKEDVAFLLSSSLDRGVSSSTVPDFEGFEDRFSHAQTPFIITQKYGGAYKNLFKVVALSAGAKANERFKISIENLTRLNATSYPTFDLVVRDFFDTDDDPVVLEAFRSITLDPNSNRFIGRAIGDLNVYFDFDKETLSQKINISGDHPVLSNYIRLELSADLKAGNIPVDALPFGFRGPLSLNTSGSILCQEQDSRFNLTDLHRRAVQPAIPYRESISVGTGEKKRVNTNLKWGVQSNIKTSVTEPNLQSLFNESLVSIVKYFPDHRLDHANVNLASDTFNNNLFNLENVQIRTGSAGTNGGNLKADPDQWVSASYVRAGNISSNGTNKTRGLEARDFEVPGNRRYSGFNVILQGGFDGLNIFNKDKSDMSNNAARREMNDVSQGERNGPTIAAYRKAVDIMGSKSDVDIKLLAIPGIREPGVTDYAITSVESRFDALYLMDVEHVDSTNTVITSSNGNISVRNTVNNFKNRGLDSSFAAAYFPDVTKTVITTRTGRDRGVEENLIEVPPSVVALGAFSYNDAVAHPWFAPAGFSRGALNAVENASVRLNRNNLDEIYDADINPLTAFPGTGVVIWGQKTLLQNSSALDRVNVRRLLINVRRAVRNVANTLLFEPNRQETLDKFNALVNPILQRVQEQGGVDRYKVIIDTTTTTQADIENNTIRGKIYLQPTRTVEFVALDFVVTNAGAEGL